MTLAPILSQLAASHEGDPWYGSPRMRFLEHLTPAQAAAHPLEGAHSIWETVLHLTSWSEEVLRRIDGGKPAAPASGDWPAVGAPTAAAWRAARAKLGKAHAAVVARARTLTAADAARPVGNGVTVAEMLVGLAQHDAYHAGQVALLHRLVTATTPQPTS
jgi:uncharacterized damage-inducible protein DinB